MKTNALLFNAIYAAAFLVWLALPIQLFRRYRPCFRRRSAECWQFLSYIIGSLLILTTIFLTWFSLRSAFITIGSSWIAALQIISFLGIAAAILYIRHGKPMIPSGGSWTAARLGLQSTVSKISLVASALAVVSAFIALILGNYGPPAEQYIFTIATTAGLMTVLLSLLPISRSSSPIYQTWVFLCILYVALLVPVTGGYHSMFNLLYIPILILCSASYGIIQTVLIAASISVIFIFESLGSVPPGGLQAVIPDLFLSLAFFLGVTWFSIYFVREIRQQTIKRESYENLAQNLAAKVAHLNALDEIASLSGTVDLETLLRETLQIVMKTFACQAGTIFLWHPDEQLLKLKSWAGLNPGTDFLELPLGASITGIAAQNRQILQHSSDNPSVIPHPIFYREQLRAVMAGPLVSGDRLLGSVTVSTATARQFTRDEETLLGMICERIALYIENARLYEQTERNAGESYALFDTARALGSLGSIDEVLRYAALRMNEIAQTDADIIVTVNPLQAFPSVAREMLQLFDTEDLRLFGEQLIQLIDDDRIEPFAALSPAQETPLSAALLEAIGIRSMILIPIRSRHQLYSLICIYTRSSTRRFDEETRNLLKALAHMVGITIDNLRLVDDLNRQVTNLTALSGISAGINGKRTLEDTLDSIVYAAARVMNKTSTILALLHEDDNLLRARSSYGVSEEFHTQFRISPSEGLARNILQHRTIQCVTDYSQDQVDPIGVVVREGLRFVMGVPLINNKGNPFGILYIGDRQPYTPTQAEIDLAAMFATQASIAITNSALYEDLEKQLKNFSSLYEISTGLSNPAALSSAALLTRKTAEILDAEYCAYFRYDEPTGKLIYVPPGYNFRPAQWGLSGNSFSLRTNSGLGYDAYTGREPILIEDFQAYVSDWETELVTGHIQDVLGVRLGSTSRMSGVLLACNKINANFDNEDKKLLSLIANLVTSFMDNSRLLTDIQNQVQNLTDLMEVANAVQGSLGLKEILDTIVAKAHTRFRAHTSQINLLNRQLSYVEIAAYRGFSPRRTRRSETQDLLLYGSNCPAMVSNRPYIFGHETDAKRCPCVEGDPTFRSYMCAPIRLGEETVGVLHVTSLKPSAYTDQDLSLLSSFAVEASLAVQRGQLYSALAEENAKVETIIQSIEDPIAVFQPDGMISRVNEAFYQVFGLPSGTASGHSLRDMLFTSPYQVSLGWDNTDPYVESTLQQGTSYTTTCHIDTPVRSYFTHMRLTPVTDPAGKTTGAVALFHDITHMQLLLDQLAHEKLRAEEASRLKTQFLANISHELHTPLHSIIGYTQCVVDGLDGPVNQEQQKDLNQVIASAENLLRLINDVLDLSKVEAGKIDVIIEPTNISFIAEDVLKVVAPVADAKGIWLRKDIPSHLPDIRTDPFRLKQILMNLTGNAVKFTENGGVTVGAAFEQDQNTVTVWVQDTGIGIEPEALSFIFDEFRQADGSTTRRFGGSGLGLSISRGLIELLGGSIRVESEPGRGSTFRVTLPAD
ncbi:MAG: GAF domain-containing protein [Solirubrobacterales bacterium]